MDILKLKRVLTLILLSLFAFILGCEGDFVQIIKLETDTFISSDDESTHAELNYTRVSKSATREDRIILKFPTGKGKEDDHLNDCLKNPLCSAFYMYPIILVKLLTSCADAVMIPANLTKAILVLNTADGSNLPAGSVQPFLLSRPWWHTVSWQQAHPFSQNGKWTTAGGDEDNTLTFDSNCNNLSGGETCAAGEVKFEMTNYFKSLITNANSIHYGFVIRALANMSAADLLSVQVGETMSPRIVATYTGSCVSGASSQEKIFYLGEDIITP